VRIALPEVSLRSTVILAADQLSCDLAGEAAILNLASGTYYGLNAIGARIWTLIQEPRVVQDLLDALLVEYDVDASRCERELIDLLRQLGAEGLIEIRDA
jgi:hypothetical protein